MPATKRLRHPVVPFLGLLLTLCATPTFAAGIIAPELHDAMAAAAVDEPIDVIVTMSDRVDPKAFSHLAKAQRRIALLGTLRQTADRSQETVDVMLRGRGIRSRRLWVINALALSAPRAIIQDLARRAGVAQIELDARLDGPAPAPGVSAAPEWNLGAIGAPDVWALGHTGAGVVVATMDTGVDIDHPDLLTRWRGGSNSWFDPHGQHPAPFDPSGHGTQTMGLLVGGDTGGSTIGVAPDASWIAVKIFDDDGQATLSAIHEGFQWLLDPDGNPASDDAPDVVSNSWGFSSLVGQCFSEFELDIALFETAGIPVIFSAGNLGPAAGTSESPANNPGALAVGAVDGSLAVAGFSSRGPSACDGRIYPDVLAPGINVRTAQLTLGGAFPNSYTTASGTSFAAPQAAGAAALLAGAFPAAGPAELRLALRESALDLGAPGPDDVSGYGLIDVLGAYEYLAQSSSTTTSTTSTTTSSTAAPTTTTTLPPSPVTLFCDTFSSGLGNWTETGEGDWNTETLHATTNYPGSGSGSPAAHSDNCDTNCTITLATAVNLQGYATAQLDLLRFLDSELDTGIPGEYLRLEAWNGSTWQTLANWSANNGADTNQWHAHHIDLAAYVGQSDFRMRFVTHESNDLEHVHVDDVCLTAVPAGGLTTTTTLLSTTTTTFIPPSTTTTTTTAPTPTTTPPTTTTTLPSRAVTLFCDTFGSGLGGWTETGEGDWNTETLHATTNYPGTGSGAPAAHSVNCDTTCTITLATALNLQGYTGAQLNLLRFVDSELDAGEYLRLEAFNGSTWQTLADWSADNAADTNQWHAHSINLAGYLGQSNFRIRFVTHESNDVEHVHVDDVCLTAIAAGGSTTTTTTLAPPTTTTVPPTTTTTLAPSTTTTTTTTTTALPATTTTTTVTVTTLPTTTTTLVSTTTTTAAPSTTTTTTTTLLAPTAHIVADARTEATNPSSNFGSSTVLSADNDSEKNAFIRINVSGTGGTVNSALLRLTVPNVTRAESPSGGRVRPIACNTWSESTVTFNNQPAITGTPGPDVGPVTQNQTVTFNLGGIITGDGTFCVVITSDLSDGVDYNSREAATNRPVVIVN